MSHKASNWLASLPAKSLTAGAFRVLFHLCDAHNSSQAPEFACYPSQELLRKKTGMSNSGLNKVLNALESDKFLARRRTRTADGAKKQTYYILGCDQEALHNLTPQSGVSPNSTLEGGLTPLQGQSLLHSRGDKPVREPVKEPVKGVREKNSDLDKEFEIALWQTFPKHPNSVKSTALRAYKRLSEKDRIKCMQGVNAFTDQFETERSKEPIEQRLRFVPHLSTFINQRRFDDVLETLEVAS